MKKNNHDEKLRRKFFKNYRKYLANTGMSEEDSGKAEALLLKLASDKRFNPILHLSFRQVCEFDVRDLNDQVLYRNYRLFDRDATLVYLERSYDYGRDHEDMVEYKELWLTEDMELVLTHCTDIQDDKRKVRYRYVEDKNIVELIHDTGGLDLVEYLMYLVNDHRNLGERRN